MNSSVKIIDAGRTCSRIFSCSVGLVRSGTTQARTLPRRSAIAKTCALTSYLRSAAAFLFLLTCAPVSLREGLASLYVAAQRPVVLV